MAEAVSWLVGIWVMVILKKKRNCSPHGHLNYNNHLSCNCLQGVGDFRGQTGAAYMLYVSRPVRGKIRCPVNSYQKTIANLA